MMRAACLLSTLLSLSVLLLSACAGSGPAPAPDDQISASFLPGGGVDQIEISAIDRLPLRGAELVDPTGHATPALSITASPAQTESFSQEFPNGAYFGSNLGVANIGSNALSPGVVGAAPNTQTKLLAIASNASIQLPDPVAYRRDWQKYRIRLHFGDPPQVENREIAAPAPPPSR
jgi:hypothetical protein